MTQIRRTTLPGTSRLHARKGPADFLDCYSVASDLSPRAAAEIVADFPGWVAALVGLRNWLVHPFGLAPDGGAAADKIGAFPVEHADAHEVVAGFDDRHLNFRVSIFAEAGHVHLATWVHPHHLGGRAYLALIMPFHILIARNALARVAAG